jgi:hypothetical protein
MSKVRAENFTDRSGNGSPNFPFGLRSAGIVTATTFSGTDGTFSGNVSIGGTLTYEDVTNIDSVGIVTARAGAVLGVTADPTKRNKLRETYFDSSGSYGSFLKQSTYLTTSATSGNLNLHLEDGNVFYFGSTSNGNSAFYINFRYDSTTALSTQTNTGDVITATIFWCSTGTSSYINVVDIDGVTQTVNWVGGSAPTDGSGSNKFDIYTFTIFDTGSGYSVFGNQTKC